MRNTRRYTMSNAVEQIAIDCCKLQQKIGLIHSKVPVLVGKTSSGKTYWIQHELSKALKLPVVKILLQNEQPDEVMGYPRYTEGEGLTYLTPAWWSDTPSIFFFDELDKARDELHASILTLMREGTVRGRPLPTGSVIICAMNEDDGLSEPMKARSLFLPFVYTQRDSSFDNVSNYLQEMWDLEPKIPEPVQCMENVHYLENYQMIRPTLRNEMVTLKTVLNGLFPKKQVPSILDMLSDKPEIQYDKLLEDNDLMKNFVATVQNPEDVAKHFVEFCKVGKSRKDAKYVCSLIRKYASTNADDLVNVYSTVHDILIGQYPNIARHEYNTEFVRELGLEMFHVLKSFTSAISEKYYDWETDSARE